MTDENWQEVGTIFKQIYQVPLPSSGFRSVRKEAFDRTHYACWIHAFETQLAGSPGKNKVEQIFARTGWGTNSRFIRY